MPLPLEQTRRGCGKWSPGRSVPAKKCFPDACTVGSSRKSCKTSANCHATTWTASQILITIAVPHHDHLRNFLLLMQIPHSDCWFSSAHATQILQRRVVVECSLLLWLQSELIVQVNCLPSSYQTLRSINCMPATINTLRSPCV